MFRSTTNRLWDLGALFVILFIVVCGVAALSDHYFEAPTRGVADECDDYDDEDEYDEDECPPLVIFSLPTNE